jgi:hypothetical protein
VRQSIGWFRSGLTKGIEDKLTWWQIKEDLDLSSSQLSYIEAKIRYAEDYTPPDNKMSGLYEYPSCKQKIRRLYRVAK